LLSQTFRDDTKQKVDITPFAVDSATLDCDAIAAGESCAVNYVRPPYLGVGFLGEVRATDSSQNHFRVRVHTLKSGRNHDNNSQYWNCGPRLTLTNITWL